MKEEKITVILCEPEKVAKKVEIENTLEKMQEIVGGLIEQFCPYDDSIAFICNEESKLNGMRLNRAVFEKDTKNIIDIICGPFFICGFGEGCYTSLSNEQFGRYIRMFDLPQRFYSKSDSNSIVVTPYIPIDEFMEKLLGEDGSKCD